MTIEEKKEELLILFRKNCKDSSSSLKLVTAISDLIDEELSELDPNEVPEDQWNEFEYDERGNNPDRSILSYVFTRLFDQFWKETHSSGKTEEEKEEEIML